VTFNSANKSNKWRGKAKFVPVHTKWGGIKGAVPFIFNIGTRLDDWSASPLSGSVPGKELLILFD